MGQYFVIALLMVASFLVGSLWTEVRYLKKGGSTTTASNTTTSAGQGVATTPGALFQSAGTVEKLKPEDHVRGDRSARIILIEYSDLECPFCKQFHPTMKQALDEYKGQVVWVYRHYPLPFHANAEKETEASECAAELGGNDAFWKYVDAVFERTTSNGTGFALDKLVPLAKEIGLDDVKFKACLDSGKYLQLAKDETTSGTQAGVNGTPGTVILDTKTGKTLLVPGAYPFDKVKQGIDSLLTEK